MADKKKNKPAVTKKMHTKQMATYSLATSPRFKTIAAKVDDGELTTAEALDMLVPKELKGEERKKARQEIAGALGSQSAQQYASNSRQKASEKHAYKKTQTRKPSFNKGGVVKKYANCGASVAGTQGKKKK